MSDINSRIAAVIKASGLTKTAFAEKLKVSQQHVSRLTKNGIPSDRTIWDICREFNVNETWLRTGEGEMIMDLDSDDEISAYVGKVLNDEKAVYQRKLLLFFSRLSPEFLEKLEEEAKRILGE